MGRIHRLVAATLSVGVLACCTSSDPGPASQAGVTATAEWPGSYPRPESLKGLKTIAVKVFADRGIPALPTAPPQPVADTVAVKTRERLTEAGLLVVDEKVAEALLSVNMYLQCESNGPACGYLTTLEVQQWTTLEREPTRRLAAITWRNTFSLGIAKPHLNALPDMLLVDAGTLLLGFLEDYRKSNQ